MPDSQTIDSTSHSTLTKLQEVDLELAVQEANLLSQLESIQEKRSSLKTVISLFAEGNTSMVQVKVEDIPATEEKSSLTSLPEEAVPPEPAAVPTTAKMTKPKKAVSSAKNSKKTTQSKHSSKVIRNASDWQQYVSEEYEKDSLTQAVTSVLQSQAERVWGISEILKEMFGEDLPQQVEAKLRHQVSNVLGGGARENKWYRGQPGFYSFLKKGAES